MSVVSKNVQHNRFIATVRKLLRDNLYIDTENMDVDVFDLEKHEDKLLFDCIAALFAIKYETGRAKGAKITDAIHGDIYVVVIPPYNDDESRLRILVITKRYGLYFR